MRWLSTKRWLPWLLIGVGAVVVVGALGWLRLRQAMLNPAAAPLPEQVGGQPLWAADRGRQAAMEIAQLHQQAFPLTAAAVGLYQGEANAQLWVSGFPFAWMADRMAGAMRDRIASNPDLPFRPTGQQQMNGHTVYRLEGLGQQHFFFASGRLVVWLAADPEIAGQALADVLAFYAQGGY